MRSFPRSIPRTKSAIHHRILCVQHFQQMRSFLLMFTAFPSNAWYLTNQNCDPSSRTMRPVINFPYRQLASTASTGDLHMGSCFYLWNNEKKYVKQFCHDGCVTFSNIIPLPQSFSIFSLTTVFYLWESIAFLVFFGKNLSSLKPQLSVI